MQQKPHVRYIIGPILATLVICSFLFTSGIVAWNFFAPKPLDIFVVNPIGDVPVPIAPTPQVVVPTEVPLLPTDAPIVVAPEPYPESEVTTPTLSLVEQSLMGWKIIIQVIKSPFTN